MSFSSFKAVSLPPLTLAMRAGQHGALSHSELSQIALIFTKKLLISLPQVLNLLVSQYISLSEALENNKKAWI